MDRILSCFDWINHKVYKCLANQFYCSSENTEIKAFSFVSDISLSFSHFLLKEKIESLINGYSANKILKFC